MLQGVSDRESDRIVQGGSSFTYEEYLWAVKSSAALYDEQKIGRRSVNVASWEPSTGNRQGLDELEVYMANQARRLPGASMNKEKWQAISTEGKVTWDKLTEADKKQILQYATQRAAAKPSIDVKFHSLDNRVPPDEPATDSDAQCSIEVMTVSQRSPTVERARSEAHPGAVKFVQWNPHNDVDNGPTEADLNDFVDAYWGTDDSDEDSCYSYHSDFH